MTRDTAIMAKKKLQSPSISPKPKHAKLRWPGLRAKDHLSRVITRAVKEARETSEKEACARNLIAWVLDYVPAEMALKLVYQERRRRRNHSRTPDSGREPRE